LEKPGHLRCDSLGQKRAGTAAQHLSQRVGQRTWLGKLENITVGHGVSLLQWRSGGENTPTIRRPTLSCRHQLLRIAPDSTRMVSVDSYKLTAGGRYLIFGRNTTEGYWLSYVLQVGANGADVATPDGRMVVGLSQGDLLTRPAASLPSLRYRPAPPRPL